MFFNHTWEDKWEVESSRGVNCQNFSSSSSSTCSLAISYIEWASAWDCRSSITSSLSKKNCHQKNNSQQTPQRSQTLALKVFSRQSTWAHWTKRNNVGWRGHLTGAVFLHSLLCTFTLRFFVSSHGESCMNNNYDIKGWHYSSIYQSQMS